MIGPKIPEIVLPRSKQILVVDTRFEDVPSAEAETTDNPPPSSRLIPKAERHNPTAKPDSINWSDRRQTPTDLKIILRLRSSLHSFSVVRPRHNQLQCTRAPRSLTAAINTTTTTSSSITSSFSMSKREGVGSPSKAKKSKMADVEAKVSYAYVAPCRVAAALALTPPARDYVGVLGGCSSLCERRNVVAFREAP